ncbi:TetR/AcrR family transcriptional regulator [Lutispora thermophila]|uniref:Transcriptional regulator, TetR family n=1 Tax=Lutispora thermophila DSM 19022 TaxID=1122184 RepID=A0A1M6E2I7_9FIRM|nr:TetR/AcrR family transcriptional regulator [Lutispora thermophila]SHI79706.1 transcriptional regulator, TetR family [Lutispora thermophila DSM 19022]
MNDMELDTKSKIMQYAIDMVGSRGDVTIRELAEAAGVNVASINYYFGSKENLLKEVEMHYSMALYNVLYSIFTSTELSPYDKLLEWAKTMSEFISQYPALISLIVKLSLDDKNYTPVLIDKIYLNKELQDMMQQIIGTILKSESKKLLKLKYLQLFSGILGPVINRLVEENFSDSPLTLNFSSKDDLEEYMKLLIDAVLA